MTHTKYTNTWQTDEWYRMILKLQRYRHLLSEKDAAGNPSDVS